MSLARTWMRQLYGASGAALLLPAAMLGALLALGLAGSFGHLGNLAQALAGPATPPSVNRSSSPGAGRPLPTVLPVAAAGGTGARLIAATNGAGRQGATAQHHASNPSAGTGTPWPVGGLAPGARLGSGTSPATPSGGGSGSGSGSGGGQPTAVDRVVGAATAITKQLPGPVGPTASQVLNSAAKTLDGLLPNQGSSAAPSGSKPTLPSVSLP